MSSLVTAIRASVVVLLVTALGCGDGSETGLATDAASTDGTAADLLSSDGPADGDPADTVASAPDTSLPGDAADSVQPPTDGTPDTGGATDLPGGTEVHDVGVDGGDDTAMLDTAGPGDVSSQPDGEALDPSDADDITTTTDTTEPADGNAALDVADVCTGCVECQAHAECPGGLTVCETGECVDGACSLVAVPGCCLMDVDCDDSDACTTDLCKWNTCFHPESYPGCCGAASECDDGNVCTIDDCSTAQCISTVNPNPPEGCCNGDTDCDDGQPCTADACVAGACVSTGPKTCCVVDSNCDDGVACTTDTCMDLGCAHTPTTPECCADDADCDDADACTTDLCVDNSCVLAPSGECEAYTFAAIGDIPYDAAETAQLEDWIEAENALEPQLPFLLHLGDIKPGFALFYPCIESIYADVSKLLLKSELPVYIVPGDNEWNDCGDVDAAWTFWSKYFMAFETAWPTHPPTVHQPVRPENMAFAVGPAVFIGLNLVGGTVHDPDEWATRMQQNVEWIESQLAAHADRPTAVIFAQGQESGDTKPFFKGMRAVVATWGKPVLYLHGDGHEYKNDQPWPEPNLYRIEVAADGAKPLHITIQPEQTPIFAVESEPF